VTPGAVPTGATSAAGAAQSELDLRLDFFKKLQTLTNQIHATRNLDEIMLDLGMAFCDLFNCERFTLYALEGDCIVSKVKTGLTSFRDLKLPVSPQSIAGYVALTRRTLNLADVYDEAELARHSPELHFQQGVDQRTGYRTRQMLVAPLLSVQSNQLLGVVQFINNRAGGQFSAIMAQGVKELCETLSIAFSQRMKPPQFARTKYDALVADAVLSGAEMDLATRSARKQELDIEHVLEADFDVPQAAIGAALAKHFKVPYEPFKATRAKPLTLLKNLKRGYLEQNGWLPLDENEDGLVVLALDPEDAYQQGVSDIHIEPLPGKGKTGIRFRKDGSLVPYIEIPASYRSALVARVKIMCDLDISERRKPQDGKIKFKKYGPLDPTGGPPDTGPGLRPQSGWGSRSHLPNEIGVFRSSILRDFKTCPRTSSAPNFVSAGRRKDIGNGSRRPSLAE
jgi:hypothetical protein